MKKLFFSLLIGLIGISLCLTLAACGGTGAGTSAVEKSGTNALYETAKSNIKALTTATTKTGCESKIKSAINVDIILPEGSKVSGANVITQLDFFPSQYANLFAEGPSTTAYYTYVENSLQTDQAYYNSIKSQMVSAGYTTEDNELSFYKVSGKVIYFLSISAIGDSGNNLVITSGVSDGTAQNNFNSNDINNNSSNSLASSSSSATQNAWPSAELSAMFGTGVIPNYIGTSTSFQNSVADMAGTHVITTIINGSSQSAIDTYIESLIQAGFTYDSYADYYTKTLSNNDIAYAEFIVNSILVTARFELEVRHGELSAWPTSQLATISPNKVIPQIVGATSFDIERIFTYSLVTAYGITQAEYEAYDALLKSTTHGFASSSFGEYSYQTDATHVLLLNCEYEEEAQKFKIDISIEEVEAAPFILPTNVKIVADSPFIFIKIGDDYLYFNDTTITPESLKQSHQMFYIKKTGNNWTEYCKETELDYYTLDSYWTAWVETGETYNVDSLNYRITSLLDFIADNDIEGYTKGTGETILGKSCVKYTENFSYGTSSIVTEKYYEPNSKLVFKAITNSSMQNNVPITHIITTYDTTITSFGVELPNA